VPVKEIVPVQFYMTKKFNTTGFLVRNKAGNVMRISIRKQGQMIFGILSGIPAGNIAGFELYHLWIGFIHI
jgi:hypothetical protein